MKDVIYSDACNSRTTYSIEDGSNHEHDSVGREIPTLLVLLERANLQLGQ
jgi:hypothetical protein